MNYIGRRTEVHTKPADIDTWFTYRFDTDLKKARLCSMN
jgi:hypothetical protein